MNRNRRANGFNLDESRPASTSEGEAEAADGLREMACRGRERSSTLAHRTLNLKFH